jgi:hypothetical protein
MIYKGYEILAEIENVGVWSVEDHGGWGLQKYTRSMGRITYFIEIEGSREYSSHLEVIKRRIDMLAYGWTPGMTIEFAQNLTDAQGIGIVYEEQSVEEGGLEFCQFYGHRAFCEYFSDSECNHDGNLWGDSDINVVSCTAHTFPEQGYEYYAVEEAA